MRDVVVLMMEKVSSSRLFFKNKDDCTRQIHALNGGGESCRVLCAMRQKQNRAARKTESECGISKHRVGPS